MLNSINIWWWNVFLDETTRVLRSKIIRLSCCRYEGDFKYQWWTYRFVTPRCGGIIVDRKRKFVSATSLCHAFCVFDTNIVRRTLFLNANWLNSGLFKKHLFWLRFPAIGGKRFPQTKQVEFRIWENSWRWRFEKICPERSNTDQLQSNLRLWQLNIVFLQIGEEVGHLGEVTLGDCLVDEESVPNVNLFYIFGAKVGSDFKPQCRGEVKVVCIIDYVDF